MPLRKKMKEQQPSSRCCSYFRASQTRLPRREDSSSKDSRPTSSHTAGRSSGTKSKLAELKLAFCLLSREIQGLDAEEGEAQVPTTGATTPHAIDDCQTACARAPKTTVADLFISSPTRSAPPEVAIERASAQLRKSCSVKEPLQSLDGAAAVSCRPEARDNRAPRVCCETRLRPRDGRTAAEAAATEAKQAKQALKQLKADLDSERKSRIATESALQQLQLQASECALEREKLQSVVNSFGGRSVEELTTASQLMERRLREAERALENAQQVVAGKTDETVEALEQAAGLAEALEAERAARMAADEGRRNATQELRCCLRARAKAEQEAQEVAAALRKSEAQRNSLAQRLEVLRTAKKRLDKRAAAGAAFAAAGMGARRSSVGGEGAGNTAVRLATARARLKTLSAAGSRNSSETAAVGQGHAQQPGVKGERAAIERAANIAVAEKKWRERLREAEAKGEVYRSAAVAAETGLKLAVRQKVELEEVNRILAERVANDEPDAESGRSITGKSKSGAESGTVPPVRRGDGGASPRRGSGGTDTAENFAGESGEDFVCASRSRRPGVPSCPPQRSCSPPATASASPTDAPHDCPSDKYRHVAHLPVGQNETPVCGASSGGTTGATMMATCNNVPWAAAESRQTMPSTSCTASLAAGAATRSNSIDAYVTGSRTSPPLEISSSNDRCRPRAASASEVTDILRGVPESVARHGDQHQRQRTAVEQNERASCCYSLCPAGGSQLLSRSRKLRGEALSTFRNGPFAYDGDGGGNGGGGGGGGGGCADSVGVGGANGGDWRGSQPQIRRGEATVTSVPIEVLLRLCGRGVRGAWIGEKELNSGGVAGGEPNLEARVSPTAANRYWNGAKKAGDNGSQESWAEPPSRISESAAEADGNTNMSFPLPPGISSALAKQVQGTVSRGDERGFLDIVERCGSEARGGIAQLLSIHAPWQRCTYQPQPSSRCSWS